LDRDDWKWFDEDELKGEDDDEEKPKASGEFQCPRCTHWLSTGTAWCAYCGTVLEGGKEKRK
jgi:hypothetical protein